MRVSRRVRARSGSARSFRHDKTGFLPLRHELIVDNFAGGGGASTGIEAAMGRPVDIAVNHDGHAITMHKANHPGTRHLCGDVFDVDPLEVTGGQPVGLAWFSPDCKHFSKAKGGKPREKKIRGLAWVVIRWAATVKPRVIMLENVEEFQDWGPLMPDGKPDPLRAGMTFRRWKKQLENQGYVVESRELRACDYGAPTVRKRLFVIARRDGRPIVWPKATHGEGLKPYRTAAECIDWTLPTPSIFSRKRPLAPATLRRIARGIVKYVLQAKKPFIVPVKTWGGGGNEPRDPDQPMRTTTCSKRGEYGIVTPLLGTNMAHNVPRPVDQPASTICTGNHKYLLTPALVNTRNGERPGQEPRTRGVADPYWTVTSQGSQGGLVSAFLEQANGGKRNKAMIGHDAREPMSTIIGKGCTQRVVTAFLSNQYTSNTRGGSGDLRAPMPTVTAGGGHQALVQAFMEEHCGPGDWTTVTINGTTYRIVDIGFRMLTPRELFRAQGFDDTLNITPTFNGKPLTKSAQMKLCGNSVCPPVAKAIVEANFKHEAAYQAVNA